jgi:hypothetical protein
VPQHHQMSIVAYQKNASGSMRSTNAHHQLPAQARSYASCNAGHTQQCATCSVRENSSTSAPGSGICNRNSCATGICYAQTHMRDGIGCCFAAILCAICCLPTGTYTQQAIQLNTQTHSWLSRQMKGGFKPCCVASKLACLVCKVQHCMHDQ